METKCPACGAPMEAGKCGYCGYVKKTVVQAADWVMPRQQAPVNKPVYGNTGTIPGISKKSKTVALMLCIFLGVFGVHRFYVGKVGTGILYLLTFGLGGIGWIVDIICIAIDSFNDEFGLLVCK